MWNRHDRRITVRFEQAVYGSFPFWDRGYDVLARSPGCRPEWLAELKAICRGYGERPRGAAGAGGLLATRLRAGPWLVVAPAEQGLDDRGRPGAVAFHALFLDGREYRKIGFDPFLLIDPFRRDWTADTRSLPTGTATVVPSPPTEPVDDRARRIAAAIARGSRVALEARGPIDELARAVWLALPIRVRKRSSLATWAFSNAHRFDLVALPRLAGVALDASYIDPATLDRVDPPPVAGTLRVPSATPQEVEPKADGTRSVPATTEGRGGGDGSRSRGAGHLLKRHRRLLATALAAAVLGAIGVALRGGGTAPSRVASSTVLDDEPDDPADTPRVAEGLAELAERFGVAPSNTAGDPNSWMLLLADRLRYRGPRLSPADLAALRAARDPESSRVLSWDDHLRHFLADRPLPADLARRPLRRRLEALAWSFHLDPSLARRPPAEFPDALAHALALPVSARPSPLAARYTPLDAYARFLARLPRR